MTLVNTLSRKPLRIALIGALAFAVPMTGMAPHAPVTAQQSKLDIAANALRTISTMKADFTQTDRANNTMRGTMTLKGPGKIRFDYGRDADFLVVSNGRSLYMIDYEVNQVERWPIGNSPLGALLDPERDVKRYGKLVQTVLWSGRLARAPGRHTATQLPGGLALVGLPSPPQSQPP